MAFGYALLRGRDGASGCVRTADGKRSVSLRGLKPGESCAFYTMEENTVTRRGEARADQTGQANLKYQGSGPLFVSAGGRVRLWEGGEENYLRAAAFLREEERKNQNVPPSEPKKEKEFAPPQERSEMHAKKETWSLRKPGPGEPVDALPALLWPGAAREIRESFDRYPPCAPLPMPGWRFVKIPSFWDDAPFHVVGRLAVDGAVRAVAYAAPGDRCPSAALPGARFQPGLDGWNYWVSVRDV